MKLAESKQTVTQAYNAARNRQSGSDRGPRALVVAPTRELVVQIEENVRAYAKHLPLRMATVFGGVSERPQMEALRCGVDLVVATPGAVDRSDGPTSSQSFRHRVSRARRGRSNARHGFSSADSPDRESIAAKTADAHVLRLAFAGDRTVDPPVSTVAQDCADWPAREPG